jgi:hypothetical protein
VGRAAIILCEGPDADPFQLVTIMSGLSRPSIFRGSLPRPSRQRALRASSAESLLCSKLKRFGSRSRVVHRKALLLTRWAVCSGGAGWLGFSLVALI